MTKDLEDFTDSLYQYILREIKSSSESPDYNHESIEIIDARNHLFRNVGARGTDEENNIYTIHSLCHLDDNMEWMPDKERISRIARVFFD